MGRRPDVARSSWPIALIDLAGLAGHLGTALVRVPFRRPWRRAGSLPRNLGVAVTRETIRSFMGYASSLQIDEFRSVELVLDSLCGAVLSPVVRSMKVTEEECEVGGVPGVWYRPVSGPVAGTILYLHGGGYVGTSPRMYAVFVAGLCRSTGCAVFVADMRLAPEFPFPAGLEDAVLVVDALLAEGIDPGRLFVAGDSSGGGLAASLLYAMESVESAPIAGVFLFSPELDLLLDQPSVADNATADILPWNIPTAAYLHGRDPTSSVLSGLDQDVKGWPPTFVYFGSDEMLRDSIRTFIAHLEEAEVETVAHEEEGMFHVFPILMPWAEASHRVYHQIGEFVSTHLP